MCEASREGERERVKEQGFFIKKNSLGSYNASQPKNVNLEYLL